jgi:hypothetical protein
MRFSGLVLPAALRTWCDSGQMQRRALTKCTGDSYNMLCAEKRREGKGREEMNEWRYWTGRPYVENSKAEYCVSREVEMTIGSFDAMVPRVSAT